jgi:glycosyltransferase involved in cell wall biosynthesis
MKLSFLIPTYNRSKFLLKNLELFSLQIRAVNGIDLIETNA